MIKVGIIGGGASGLMAALEASNSGCDVTVFERKDRIGKKILATGNGRCNFTNRNMSKDYYYSEDESFIERLYEKFGLNDLLMYFHGLGLLIKEKNGYFYPSCEQASAVLDTLRYSISDKKITVLTDTYIVKVERNKNGFTLNDEAGKRYHFDKIIISCGGKAGISKKEYANGYDLLKSLGHSVTKLYPSLTQIKCDGNFFKALSGVRSDCSLFLFSNENLLMQQQGEVLFTDYGISGIVSFQVSHCVASCIDKKEQVMAVLDLLPGMESEDLKAFALSKYLLHPDMTVEEYFTGFHNKKLNMEIIKISGLKPNAKLCEIDRDRLVDAILMYKEFVVNIVGVNDFDQAQVTGGGVPTAEVNDYCESTICPGLFITGELLDVDGICGGYNLQWAFSTGAVAGRAVNYSEV